MALQIAIAGLHTKFVTQITTSVQVFNCLTATLKVHAVKVVLINAITQKPH